MIAEIAWVHGRRSFSVPGIVTHLRSINNLLSFQSNADDHWSDSLPLYRTNARKRWGNSFMPFWNIALLYTKRYFIPSQTVPQILVSVWLTSLWSIFRVQMDARPCTGRWLIVLRCSRQSRDCTVTIVFCCIAQLSCCAVIVFFRRLGQLAIRPACKDRFWSFRTRTTIAWKYK